MVEALHSFGFEAMASRCEVRLAASQAPLAQRAIDEVRRIESKYSRYRADSVVGRINAGGSIELDAETDSLLDYAAALHASSDGLFDITSGVLRRAWDFRRPVLPKPDALQALLGLVGWHKVRREPGRIRLPLAGMEIDFGGFGKEYAADRAAAILIEGGARHGYVNLGGDMRFIGPRPDGEPWRIGIQDPRAADGLAASIPLSLGALATSGDYERYVDINGKRYCHVLDPRTGMPVSHWRSVSVLAPVAIAAGSCATIAMLMQADGLAFLEQSGMAFLAIDQQGQVFRKDA